MAPSADTDQRLTELEIKASFSEDLLEQLNQIIIRQQQDIDTLVRLVSHLRAQTPDSAAGQAGAPRDELPPHY